MPIKCVELMYIATQRENTLMKQIVKTNKIIISGSFSEIIMQIKLLGLKYTTLKQLLDDFQKTNSDNA